MAAALAVAFSAAVGSAQESGPWPAAVPGFVAPAPGEHPRLFFRKTDLPELRRRAETPEGRAIVKRLRQLLDGADGTGMPPSFNKQKKAYEAKESHPEGTYSISHAAGYGMLYQLTGDRKYADLGRKCFELAFEGVRDRDGEARYSFRSPGGALRAGPSLAWYAAGYDLCHDGWDEDFRKRVAGELINYNGGPNMEILAMAAGKRHGPGSNHWGPQIAGPAMAALAVRGDAGVDDKRVAQILATSEKAFLRQMTEGWGDHGWFAEGDGPGTIASDTAFVPALQAWRVAGGKDFITPRPNAQWMTLKWVMLTLPVAADADAKHLFPHRGVYDHNVYQRTGLSGSGTFCQGFGAVEDKYRPALAWMYRRTFEAADTKAGRPADTASPYPHRAVLALVNWPLGSAEKNPGEVLPKAVADRARGFVMFRNRWQDGDDVIVTALLRPSKGNYSVPAGEILVRGAGGKATFPVKVTGDLKHFESDPHGGVFATSAGSFGADFSGAAGCEAVLVLSGAVGGGVKAGGDGAFRTAVVDAGGASFTVMTIAKSGKHPDIAGRDGRLTVGGLTAEVKDGRLVFTRTGK